MSWQSIRKPIGGRIALTCNDQQAVVTVRKLAGRHWLSCRPPAGIAVVREGQALDLFLGKRQSEGTERLLLIWQSKAGLELARAALALTPSGKGRFDVAVDASVCVDVESDQESIPKEQ